MNNKWQLVLDKLKDMIYEENGKISEAAFDGFLKGIKFLNMEENTVFLGVYNEFNRKRILDKFYDILLEIIREVPEWSDVEKINILVDEYFLYMI